MTLESLLLPELNLTLERESLVFVLHDLFQVDVVNRTATADLTNYTPNGEWTLAESPVLVRRVKKYTCCTEPFPEIVITFHIRRKTLYYMYNIVFPCMMMSTLTGLS